MKPKITVFQALTLLAQKYRASGDSATYAKIKSLYLSGVREPEDQFILTGLLADKALSDYEISQDRRDINEDPVRRYFESQLAHETLKSTLDNLDQSLLEAHFNSIFAQINSKSERRDYTERVYNKKDPKEFFNDSIDLEYGEAIRVLKEESSYRSLMPKEGTQEKTPEQILTDRKAKIILLEKSAHAATRADPKTNPPLPIYVHEDLNGPYSDKRRGKIDRETKRDKTVVPAQNLGIMRTYMPVPQDDPVHIPEPAHFIRPADVHTYLEDGKAHETPDKIFATQVTPFVSSLSGTMLAQLKAIAQLCREQKYAYNTPEARDQIKDWFKSFVSALTYTAGGHSLEEYMMVLRLPEVQKEFKAIPEFRELTLEELFKKDNQTAFEQAVEMTINYNANIVNKKAIAIENRERVIDSAYRIYTTTPNDKERNNAVYTLKDLLDLPESAKHTDIHEKIIERSNHLLESLRSEGQENLAGNLDKAWNIYLDDKRTTHDRFAAQSFLVETMKIELNHFNQEHLNLILQKLMVQRELCKELDPHFIPQGKNVHALNDKLIVQEDLHGIVERVNAELADYQTETWKDTLHQAKDALLAFRQMPGLTAERKKLAQSLSEQLMAIPHNSTALKDIHTFIDKLTHLQKQAAEDNTRLANKYDKKDENSGRLAQKIRSMQSEIQSLRDKVSDLEETQSKLVESPRP